MTGIPHPAGGKDSSDSLSSGAEVTVVIPAYRSAHLVGRAVASMAEQTVRPARIIVVDDGSDDDTAQAARAAGAEVIVQANAGPGAARNTGIRAATTPWIALLDADDIALPHRIATQLQHFDDPGVAVICSGPVAQDGAVASEEITFEILWDRNIVPTSSVLLRRDAWEAVGGFDERRELIGVEDYHLWLRLARAGWRLRAIEGPLVQYLPNEASLTRQSRRFVAAELANLGAIADTFGLPAESIREKEYRIRLAYGLDFFHERDFEHAARHLGAAARIHSLPPAVRLRHWIARVAQFGPRTG